MNRYTLHVTRKCNLQCEYCYETITDSHIEWSVVKDNIDFIFRNSNSDEIEIEFIGGEPFLNFQAIKSSVLYIEQTYPTFHVGYLVTTNGTVFFDDIIKLISDYHIKVFFSIDGIKFAHNVKRVFKVSRKGSYDTVISNIKKLLLIRPDLVYVQTTVHKHNIGYLYEGIRNIYDLGVRTINIGTVFTDIDNSFRDEFIKQHQVIINHLDSLPGLYLYPMMDMYETIHQQSKEINGPYLDQYVEVLGQSHLNKKAELNLAIKNLYQKREALVGKTEI